MRRLLNWQPCDRRHSWTTKLDGTPIEQEQGLLVPGAPPRRAFRSSALGGGLPAMGLQKLDS